MFVKHKAGYFALKKRMFCDIICVMERIKLVVQYDGTNFCGWQLQPEKRTVQGEIEKVLAFLLKEEVRLYASGRTDAGVSAYAQVCHFDTEKSVNEKKLCDSLNALLPEDVAVLTCEKVGEEFDSRFSVKKKTYQYKFYVSKYKLPLFEKTALRVNHYADVGLMNEACKYLIGTFDFESFVSAKSGKTDFVRTIYDAKIVSFDDGTYALEITGNGFLYNMVRIVFGTLLKVAYKKMKPEDIKKVIDGKDRSLAGKTVSSHALFMKKVDYQG